MSDNGPFPSGPWRGFYVYAGDGARHGMSMRLTFQDGVLSGAGDDDIGPFTIKGRYDAESLEVYWTKTYVGRHSVYYKGFGEPARIWGTWELPGRSGGFKIWPGCGDLSLVESAEADVPSDVIALRYQASGISSRRLQESAFRSRQDQDSANSWKPSAPDRC